MVGEYNPDRMDTCVGFSYTKFRSSLAYLPIYYLKDRQSRGKLSVETLS